jgi:hypothetical protein
MDGELEAARLLVVEANSELMKTIQGLYGLGLTPSQFDKIHSGILGADGPLLGALDMLNHYRTQERAGGVNV